MVRSARQEQGQNTVMGYVFGSPQYMSPEQARGESDSYDARTDVYALGATLYHILTLEPPVSGEDVGEMIMSVATGKVGQFIGVDRGPKSASSNQAFRHMPNGKIPDELAAICRKAMSLKQADRYASVQELQKAVEAFQGGLTKTAGGAVTSHAPVKLLYGVIAALALTVIGLIVVLLKT